LLAPLVPATASAEIYKCATPSGTTYQAIPCDEEDTGSTVEIQDSTWLSRGDGSSVVGNPLAVNYRSQ
jgi:hypothetical protein